MLYDYETKKCYKGSNNPATGKPFSKKYMEAEERQEKEREAESLKGYIQAQEDAFFERQNRYWHVPYYQMGQVLCRNV